MNTDSNKPDVDPENIELLPFDTRCDFCRINSRGGIVENGVFDKFYNFENADSPNRLGNNTPTIEIPGISQANVVYTDLVPLAPFHLMLIPRGHATSSVQMPDQEGLKADSSTIIDFIKRTNPNRSIVIFEHGSGIGSDNSLVSMCSRVCNGTIHSHVHFLPAPTINPYTDSGEVKDWDFEDLRTKLIDFLSPFGWDALSPIRIADDMYGSRPMEFVGQKPYLMLGVLSPGGEYREISLLHDDDQLRKVPSQTFRRVLSTELNSGRLASEGIWDYHYISASYIMDGFKLQVDRYRRWLRQLTGAIKGDES